MPLLPMNPDSQSRRPFARSFGDLFNITDAVGPEAANARDDVIRAQILLGESGDLDLDSLGGPTGWPGGELTRGLKRYQRRKGLTVDGLMLPDGETIRALRDDLGEHLADYRAPTTGEVDGFHDRLARYRAAGSEDVELPRLELPRVGDKTPVNASHTDMPRPATVVSDVDFNQPQSFIPGAQVAQAEVMQMMQAQQAAANAAAAASGAAGSAGTAGAAKRLPPGVTPEMDKVGRQLEKWVGDGVNLLTLPVQLQRYLTNGTPIKLPSALLDPAMEAASKTPPLKPSAPEEQPPEGSKVEEREPTLEELIPPEMKPWAEGLEPFDQQLARELMLVYNRRGGPETIKGNAIIVKEVLDALKKYPALADSMKHVGGSHSPKDGQPGKGKYLKEQHFPNAQTGGKKGGSWADITFEAKPDLAKELGIRYLHLSSARLLKDGKTAVSDEREKKARLEKNSPDSRVEIAEKPVATRIDGSKIPYDWESYQARMRDFAEQLVEEVDAMRTPNKP